MLAELVYTLCRGRGLSIATAESCTAGRLASTLAELPGASSVFTSGVVCYSDDAKVSLAGVRRATLEQHTAVSSEVAQEMAEGIAHRLGADIGIATTGYLGPTGGDASCPIGTVWIAVSLAGRTYSKRLRLHGPRTTLMGEVVSQALRLLCLCLTYCESDTEPYSPMH